MAATLTRRALGTLASHFLLAASILSTKDGSEILFRGVDGPVSLHRHLRDKVDTLVFRGG